MEVADASQSPADRYDVVILGGSFSGSSLGLLLRRRNPGARVLILEKSTAFERRVGESTSEVAGCFLTRVLGLSNYLSRDHFQKHGLRMWFDRSGNEDPERCSEIGPFSQVRLPTYQLDRSLLDEHLLEQARAEGCEVLRGSSVDDVDLGGAGNNQVRFHRNAEEQSVDADWVADCSGRAALIARKRGTFESIADHPVHSMWVRFENVRNLDSEDAFREAAFLRGTTRVARAAATNHLLGHGWWSWIIPLANGDFSAGVTWDERLFTPPSTGPVGERVKAHLLEHRIGRLMFEAATPVENDARSLKNLAYRSSEICGDGWILAGDSAGFMDPLYSQGLDYCAHEVFVAQAILGDALAGKPVAERLDRYNREFRESFDRWFAALYQDKYQYLGDADLMRAAFLLDIGTYFIGPVQLVYNSTEREFATLPYAGSIGQGFAKFMALYNRRLETIARKRLRAGTYGRNNVGKRYLIKGSFEAGPGTLKHIAAGLMAWGRLELETAFARPAAGLPRDPSLAASGRAAAG